jgi:hypothetical protein
MDGQDRTRRCANNLFGHAAHQHVGGVRASVGAHHNQIDTLQFGVLNNFVGGYIGHPQGRDRTE